MSMNWKKLRHRAEWLAVRGMANLIPLLPRGVCQFLADVIGGAASFVYWPGRKVALSNLALAFPEMPIAQRKRVATESFQYFARGVTDLFWSPRVTRENLAGVIDCEDLERLAREFGTDRGAIFASLHFGGFEWIGAALGLHGFELTYVTQAFKNPLLDDTFNELREIFGHRTIRREGAILRLTKALRKQRSTGLTLDLTVSPKLPSVVINCFGMQTCVTFAHAWLHQHTGAPIVPVHCEPQPDGRYKLLVHTPLTFGPEATHQQIAQTCWDWFEPHVRRNPAPWLWMYKHWRYLPPAASRPYPDYANDSPYFRKLLARTENANAAAEAPTAETGATPAAD